MTQPPTLIVFGGLPGAGKTTLARLLSQQLAATYVRIDSIEHALSNPRPLAMPMEDAGYRVAYAIAADNLRLGRTVITDSVNPVQLTRDAWRALADATAAKAVEIEVVCSDVMEHRLRVESRQADIPGLLLPTWREVCAREYHSWDRAHIVVDTANSSVEQTLAQLRSLVATTLYRPTPISI